MAATARLPAALPTYTRGEEIANGITHGIGIVLAIAGLAVLTAFSALHGDAWHVVATPVGRLGILLGEESLYPEAGRVLAYQGADLLVTLAACGNEALAAYVRQATLALAQENRCFAITSFLVGKNRLAYDDGAAGAFVGRSGIYAPLEMTPRYSGVLVEMGTAEAEGLLTAELDRDRLRELWETGVEPVRRRMPVSLFANYLPALYGSRRTLAEVWPDAEATAPVLSLPAPTEPLPEADAAPAPSGAAAAEVVPPDAAPGGAMGAESPPTTEDEDITAA